MGPWTVPYGIAVVLLVAAGVAKVLEPRDTAGALARSGRPVSPAVVRIGAAFEVGLGAAAIVGGTRTAAAVVGLSYLAFAGFVIQALLRHLPVGSCGCFGRVDTPPSAWHVAVNLGCAGASIAAAMTGPEPWLGVPEVGAATAIATVVLVVVGTALTAALLTAVPRGGIRR
ncbi:MAG: hypothetical protein RL531_1157 [Actinomycetota bacterium]|jgi:hypothetical protein